MLSDQVMHLTYELAARDISDPLDARAAGFRAIADAAIKNAVCGDPEVPLGAAHNGRAFIGRIQNYGFRCQGGPLEGCSDWQELVSCFAHLAAWVESQASVITRELSAIAAAEAAIADLKVNALFESVTDYPSGAVRASQYVAVKRTERADDGSLTVVIDYWPTRKASGRPAMPLSTRDLPNLPPLESERAWNNGPYRYTENQMLAYGHTAIATYIAKNGVST